MGQVEKCPTPYATTLSSDPSRDPPSDAAGSQAENISVSAVALSAPFEMALTVVSWR